MTFSAIGTEKLLNCLVFDSQAFRAPSKTGSGWSKIRLAREKRRVTKSSRAPGRGPVMATTAVRAARKNSVRGNRNHSSVQFPECSAHAKHPSRLFIRGTRCESRYPTGETGNVGPEGLRSRESTWLSQDPNPCVSDPIMPLGVLPKPLPGGQ